MPLARIVTRTPQDAFAASDYLRSLGYTVETISPGEFRVTPAELELRLEKCRPEEALARAKALVEAFRAPDGAKSEAPAPPETPMAADKPKVAIAYDIAGRPVEFADEAEERHGTPNGIGRALVAMLVRARQRVATVAGQTGAAVLSPIRNFQQRRAEERALKLEYEVVREQEEMRREEQLARERVERDIERQRLEEEAAERRRQQRVAAEKEAAERRRIAAERAAAEQRDRVRIESERAALAAEQERARQEADQQARLQAEEGQTAIAAERRAQEEERTRIASLHEAMIAAQRQAESHLPSASLSDRSGASEAPLQPAAPEVEDRGIPGQDEAGPALATAHDALRHRPPQKRAKRWRPFAVPPPPYPPISGKAIAVAAGAAFVLVLGFVAYANRRPASPLPTGSLLNTGSVKQQTPFGAATVAPPATTPASVIPKPSPAAVVPKPSPATAAPATKPSPAAPATPRKGRRLWRASEEDSVAEDEVVVRRFQKPVPKRQSTISAAKLKQYSDME